jgi:hypothetical protein
MKYSLLLMALCIFQATLLAQEPHPISGVNMKKNSRWPSDMNGKTVIGVSWENPSYLNEQERNWVKSTIEATWEQYANIDFTGWDKSGPFSKGIRIDVDPYGWPHTKGLGTALDGVPNGMLLNFSFLGRYRCPPNFTR